MPQTQDTSTKKSTRYTRSNKQRRGQNFVQRKEISGYKIKVPDNPPDVTSQPWYNLTVLRGVTGKLDMDVGELAKNIRSQLDPTKRGMNHVESGDSRFIIQMRLQSVTAWNLTSGARLIALSVEDFHDTISATGGRDQLCGIVDTGGATSAPKVGYYLPSSHRSTVLRNDDLQASVILFNVQAGSKDQLLVQTKVLFRFDGPSSLPTIFNTTMSDIAQRIDRVARGVSEVYDNMPATHISTLGTGAVVIPSIIPVSDFQDPDQDQIETLHQRLTKLEVEINKARQNRYVDHRSTLNKDACSQESYSDCSLPIDKEL